MFSRHVTLGIAGRLLEADPEEEGSATVNTLKKRLAACTPLTAAPLTCLAPALEGVMHFAGGLRLA